MAFGDLFDRGHGPPLGAIRRQHRLAFWHGSDRPTSSQHFVEADTNDCRCRRRAQRAQPDTPGEARVYPRALVEATAETAMNPVQGSFVGKIGAGAARDETRRGPHRLGFLGRRIEAARAPAPQEVVDKLRDAIGS
ncbi:MAG: hypothetical protein E6J05_02425 [Chloroflexi bacterium]|nr:MAG: hypothetical protein E6J05_02425 [Chloroflexota bacterium]